MIISFRDSREICRECLDIESASQDMCSKPTLSTCLPTFPRAAYQAFKPFSTSFLDLVTAFWRSVNTTFGSSPVRRRVLAVSKCWSRRILRGPEDEVDVDEESCSRAWREVEMSIFWILRIQDYGNGGQGDGVQMTCISKEPKLPLRFWFVSASINKDVPIKSLHLFKTERESYPTQNEPRHCNGEACRIQMWRYAEFSTVRHSLPRSSCTEPAHFLALELMAFSFRLQCHDGRQAR